MNKLIINADDFGLCDSVNEAIVDCFLQKNLTSATIMVNTKSSNKALELSKKYNIPLGLHFNIVRGKSLVGRSTITDNENYFFSRKELFKKIIKNQVNPRDIQLEFLAQIKFLEDEDVNFTHFDSDNHSHFNPFIIKALRNIIISRNINVRNLNPLRFSNPLLNLNRNIKQTYHKLINLFFWDKNFQCNNYLTSIYDLNSLKKINKDDYTKLIKTNYSNIILELMVHPYKKSEELFKIYTTKKEIEFVNNCIKEYEILSNDFGLFLNQNYQLSNFKDLISS